MGRFVSKSEQRLLGMRQAKLLEKKIEFAKQQKAGGVSPLFQSLARAERRKKV